MYGKPKSTPRSLAWGWFWLLSVKYLLELLNSFVWLELDDSVQKHDRYKV